MKRVARLRQAAAGEAALALARAKAAVPDCPGAIVIGCDQILVCGQTWYDKPADMAAARAQLMALRGQTHTLETACVAMRNGAEIFHDVATPRLTMRAFSDGFLDAYLAAEGEAVLGSVGAYRLEGPGIQLFEQMEGDHSAILGLPLLPLLGFLRSCGIIAV
jgi:septum formation protein